MSVNQTNQIVFPFYTEIREKARISAGYRVERVINGTHEKGVTKKRENG